ncbi:serine incorporator 4 [Elysia marginata]|uniref:Serine incorporator 4 n=1 Tax=Elysia marginata TaxID=1093978 RepID=A0AAV4IMY4_9GAST|nr:serine incorporator 4 [Elysia marginata]
MNCYYQLHFRICLHLSNLGYMGEQIACCLGPASCALCCESLPPINESTGTRAMYIGLLTISFLVQCVMLIPGLKNIVEETFVDVPEFCVDLHPHDYCTRLSGYRAVYRVSLAVVAFHVLMMLLTAFVPSSNHWRASIQNGYWLFKVALLAGFGVASFYVPRNFSRCNPNAGLLQASVICCYVVYLTWAGLTSEPPEKVQSPIAGLRQVGQVMALVASPPEDIEPLTHRVVDQSELKPAYDESVMYNSTCRPDPSFPETDNVAAYVGIFIMFVMAVYASPWIADLSTFGLNWAAVWVKMASSWVCVATYIYSLYIPRFCFGRNLAFPYKIKEEEIEVGDDVDGSLDEAELQMIEESAEPGPSQRRVRSMSEQSLRSESRTPTRYLSGGSPNLVNSESRENISLKDFKGSKESITALKKGSKENISLSKFKGSKESVSRAGFQKGSKENLARLAMLQGSRENLNRMKALSQENIRKSKAGSQERLRIERSCSREQMQPLSPISPSKDDAPVRISGGAKQIIQNKKQLASKAGGGSREQLNARARSRSESQTSLPGASNRPKSPEKRPNSHTPV